jgi:hypothetical protein
MRIGPLEIQPAVIRAVVWLRLGKPDDRTRVRQLN